MFASASASASASAQNAHTDSTLIDRALGGERSALRLLTGRLQPSIARRVERVLRRFGQRWLAEASDVAQMVWIALWKDGGRQLRAFDPARGIGLEAYAGMIAEREARNHLKATLAAKRGALRSVDLSDACLDVTPAPEATVEEELMARSLATALSRHLETALPGRALAVLERCVGEGDAPASVAQSLSMPAQHVYNWLHRARRISEDYLTAQAA